MINICTVEGDLISGCEMFDETDLDAALAQFEELQPAIDAARKRGNPNGSSNFLPASGSATGMPWQNYSPTTFPQTIGVRS